MADTPLRVMIVDDSPSIRKAAENFLAGAGCIVMLAEDGFDCAAKIKDFSPQLLFIDIEMPRINGYQVTELIRAHKEMKDIPVVMLSSRDGLFDKAKGMAAGATDYVTKPFSREDLVTSIEKHVPGFKSA